MTVGHRCWTARIILMNPAHHRLVFPSRGFGPLRRIVLLAPDGIQRQVPFPASRMLRFPGQSQQIVCRLMPFAKVWS